MLDTKRIFISLSTALITVSSNIALAAENTISDLIPPIWPLLLFIAIVVIFRKQLNCVKPADPGESSEPVNAEQEKPEVSTEDTVVAKTNNQIINLKDNRKQCQASTAKGSRCKRKTMLKDTSITMDGKTYHFTVCKQHNTKSTTPFSGLIKKARRVKKR